MRRQRAASGIIVLMAIAILGGLLTEAQAAEPRTLIVSRHSSGPYGNALSEFSDISADGRFVAFQSDADNLVSGDTNASSDVFVHDLMTARTTLVSRHSSGPYGNSDSRQPSISDDGRFVAFESFASNLVSGDTNGDKDVFVHDRLASTTGRTTIVSRHSSGPYGNGNSGDPAISADGRFVAFESFASNLVSGDTNGTHDVFVHDRLASTIGRTFLVSRHSSGPYGNGASGNPDVVGTPDISADGRFVAFDSEATNLVSGDTAGHRDVFVHDRLASTTGRTTRVSRHSLGNEGNGVSRVASISANGRFVAFESFASNLVSGDTNGVFDVFVHDRLASTTGRTTRVSRHSLGNEGNSSSFHASISGDGRFVAFTSSADNLVSGDGNGDDDVFVHRRF